LTIEAYNLLYNTYNIGIIGFPSAFEHDMAKCSVWCQTRFEGPFRNFYHFTKYFRNFQDWGEFKKSMQINNYKGQNETSYQFWSNCDVHLGMILILTHFWQSWLDTNWQVKTNLLVIIRLRINYVYKSLESRNVLDFIPEWIPRFFHTLDVFEESEIILRINR
jgi:hypothetical protein